MPRFRKKNVLTGTDLAFFRRLHAALPECIVCTQVAVQALIEPVGMGKLRHRGVIRLSGRRVANAVFDEDMRLIAVVELKHPGRVTRGQAAVDACFANAGIPVIRFPAHRLPSEGKLRTAIFARARTNAAGGTSAGGDSIEFHRPPNPWRNTLGFHP